MKVIGYARVSTNEQAEQGVSLDAQEARIRAYCTAQEWECVEVVRDDGYSAKDLKRPGLGCLLAEAQRTDRRFEGVVVPKLDRLTRSVRDLHVLTDLFTRHRLAMVSIQEAFDTSTATGQLFYTLVAALSEWERGVIGERTREALAHKRRRGERAGPVPYGYDLAADGQRLTANADEKAILAVMQAGRAKGESYALIADSLNADRTPTKHGGRWYAATVRSVVRTAARWANASNTLVPNGAANGHSFTGRLRKSGSIRAEHPRGVRVPERRPPHTS
jgi:DNA invertase Pin-like site-specific DNA recombinase